MSAGGDHSDVRDDVPEGDGPPPGFDPPLDRGFGAPDNPPEPSFGARAYRGSDTSGSAASGLHQEWGYWSKGDREHDREARDDATRDEWHGSKWSQWEGGDAQAWGSAWGDSSRHGDDRLGWGRRSSWDATMSTAPGSVSDTVAGNSEMLIHGPTDKTHGRGGGRTKAAEPDKTIGRYLTELPRQMAELAETAVTITIMLATVDGTQNRRPRRMEWPGMVGRTSAVAASTPRARDQSVSRQAEGHLRSSQSRLSRARTKTTLVGLRGHIFGKWRRGGG